MEWYPKINNIYAENRYSHGHIQSYEAIHPVAMYAKRIEINLIYYDVLNLNSKRVNKKRILISTALAFSIPVTRPLGYMPLC